MPETRHLVAHYDLEGTKWWFLDLGEGKTKVFTENFHSVCVFKGGPGKRVLELNSVGDWRDVEWACRALTIQVPSSPVVSIYSYEALKPKPKPKPVGAFKYPKAISRWHQARQKTRR